MSAALDFPNFPPELFVETFKHLSFKQKQAIARICKLWRFLLNSNDLNTHSPVLIRFSQIDNPQYKKVSIPDTAYHLYYLDGDYKILLDNVRNDCLKVKREPRETEIIIVDEDLIGQIHLPSTPNLEGFSCTICFQNSIDRDKLIQFEESATDNHRHHIKNFFYFLSSNFSDFVTAKKNEQTINYFKNNPSLDELAKRICHKFKELNKTKYVFI